MRAGQGGARASPQGDARLAASSTSCTSSSSSLLPLVPRAQAAKHLEPPAQTDSPADLQLATKKRLEVLAGSHLTRNSVQRLIAPERASAGDYQPLLLHHVAPSIRSNDTDRLPAGQENPSVAVPAFLAGAGTTFRTDFSAMRGWRSRHHCLPDAVRPYQP